MCVHRNVQAQLKQVAFSQNRAIVTDAWNMVSWTPEAIASFESSANTGPLVDICIPAGANVGEHNYISGI